MTPAAPPARHHFTRLDQIDQLVDASEADADLGFMARITRLCSVPRANPGDRLQFKRVNGPYTLVMFSSGETKLPYGNIPRLLLAWVCTEAVRTQSPDPSPECSIGGLRGTLCGLFVLREQVDNANPSCQKCLRYRHSRRRVKERQQNNLSPATKAR